MPAEFSDIRLSFIWAETVTDGLKEPARLFNRRYLFAPLFEKAREQAVLAGPPPGTSLQAPWPKPTGQRFWQSYLDKAAPASVTGEQAWKSFVPLRAKTPFPITTPAGMASNFEVFFYPYGLALLGTIRLSGKFSLETAVDEALKIRRDKIFTVTLPGAAEQSLALEKVADEALNRMRDWGWGKGSAASRSALDPFSVFTITQGNGVDDVSLSDAADVQRTLYAVTNWKRLGKTEPLPDLVKARVSSKAAPATPEKSLVYGTKRGRAVWFPGLLIESDRPTLACYHRNLALASMQIESLCGFAHEMANQVGQNKALAFVEEECARNAAGLLGRLYGGKSSIYRSWSVRAQIDQNNFVDDINTVRALFPPMTPLS